MNDVPAPEARAGLAPEQATARPPSSATEDLVRVTDLVKHFPITVGILVQRQVGAVQAVDGVSFTIRRGETLGLVGESGSGKSTTARLLLRLLEPTAGRIELEGTDITTATGSKLRTARQEMQMIFQDPYASLDPRMTVRDIVGEPLVVWGRWKNGGSTLVADLLDRVGLNPDHANRFPHSFSGGQRQRIAIARALALRPRLLVCDEPVSALDVSVQAQVINLLVDMQPPLGPPCRSSASNLGCTRQRCRDGACSSSPTTLRCGASSAIR